MKIIMRLYQRDNGYWYVSFSRTKRISLGTKDKALAQRLFRRAKKEHLEKKITVLGGGPPKKTLKEFADEFLEFSFKTKKRFSYQTDKQAFRRAISFLGGDTPLTRINKKLIDSWLAQMSQEVKRTSANTWFRHFKAAISKAIEWGYITDHPCKGIKQLRIQRGFPRYLTKDEVNRLLEAEMDQDFRRLWKFMVLAGCRRSEALQITHKDINWQQHRIDIGVTKNGEPKFIVITDDIAEIIREIPAEVGRLFPWKPDSVTHHFERVARAAGLKYRLHDLRHTYGSWLAMAGVKLQVIKDLMGHQDIKTTMIYAHLSQAHLEEAAGKVRIREGD
jgi:integrase